MAVFFYDLLRTTRRGRVALLRTLYALALLAALYGGYARWFPADKAAMVARPTSEIAKFAEEFVSVFLMIQMGAVVLLTPAYTAGAIAEERQRGTLELLLTTHLTPTQIVLGKFAARLAHILGILLTGLPILALLPLWGGVAPGLILSGFAVTGLCASSLAALSIWLSVEARTVRGAIAGTYAYTTLLSVCPFCMCVSPFIVLLAPLQQAPIFDEFLQGLAIVTAAHGVLTAVLLFAAVRGLTRRRRRAVYVPPAQPVVARNYAAQETGVRLASVFGPPPISDRPLLWKELHFGGSNAARLVVRLLQVFGFVIAVIIMSLFFLSAWIGGEDQERRELNVIIRAMAVVVMTVATLGALLQATACIGREREEGTLDMLLTLPSGRDEVLGSKWLGSAFFGRWLLLGLLIVLLLGVIAGALHPFALPAIAVAAAVHVALATSLGLYLSVATASTERAAMIAMAVLLAACLFPVVFCPGGVGAVPPIAWVMCLPRQLSESPWEGSSETAHALLIGLFIYGCVAWVFWLLAVRRFHKDAKRVSAVA